MTMRIIRLSYPIGNKDTLSVEQFKIPAPRMMPLSQIADGMMSNVSKMEIGLHSGTHIDVPRHFDQEGLTVDAFEMEDFIFSAPLLVNIPKNVGEEIEPEDLRNSEERINESDLLLIRTGFSKYRLADDRLYVYEYPGISPEAATYLADNFRLKGIAVDLLSIENIPKGRSRGFEVHKTLLCRRRKFIIIEDINLEPLLGEKLIKVYAIPLVIRDAEASPVTVFAEIG
jgi:arylformamidase